LRPRARSHTNRVDEAALRAESAPRVDLGASERWRQKKRCSGERLVGVAIGRVVSCCWVVCARALGCCARRRVATRGRVLWPRARCRAPAVRRGPVPGAVARAVVVRGEPRLQRVKSWSWSCGCYHQRGPIRMMIEKSSKRVIEIL